MDNYYDMIAALTADYLNVYLIWPEIDKGTIIKLDGYVTEGIKEERKEFSYSKMLTTYANSRVYKEDIESFLSVALPEPLIKNFSDGKERLEFNYRVPIDGTLQHYSGLYTRISKIGEPLKIVCGFRNTESIISIQKKTRTEGLYSAYGAIANVYLSMHRVNVKNNTYSTIKTTDDILKYTIKDSNKFDENVNSIIKGLAKEEYYNQAIEFLDINTLESRMKGKNHISINFVGKVAGLCKLHFMKEDDDKNSRLNHVIFAVEVLEEGKYQSAFDALSSNYKNVYSLDLNKGTAIILKFIDEFKDGRLDDLIDQEFPYEGLLNDWINESVHVDDRENLKRALSIDNLKQVFSHKDELTGNYRMVVGNQTYNYQYNLKKLNKDGKVIAGFQNIDKIIKEHAELERKEREKEEAYQRELRKHNELISSLSTIYSSIFRVNIDSKKYEILNETKKVQTDYNKLEKYEDAVNFIVSNFVEKDVQAKMFDFLDLSTIRERLKDTNTMVIEYKNPQGRWLQGRFIVQNRNENNEVEDVLYAARDITLEKQKELLQQERLEALSKDYSAVFSCDLISDSMTMVKMKPTSHFYSNQEYTTSFSKWIEFSYDNVIIKESAKDYLEVFNKNYLINYLKDHEMLLYRHKVKPNKAGHEYYEVRIVPYFVDDKSYKVMWAFRSIDEIIEKERQQQEQLSIALNDAKHANRAKSTFLNSMSHDIRTPMNAIIGFTALAQTHIDNTALVQDYLSKISTSSSHLLSLINDILDMSRIESGKVKLEERPVHIPDVMHDLKTMVQGLVNAKNQNLFIDTIDVEHEDVITDKLRLNQVLINIVGNAIKFTDNGGDITICLKEKPCNIKDYTTYEFSIEDTGVGMSKEFMSHIFDTFAREYSSTVSGIQGSGLGMAITKNIVVDMMGGNIEVESEVGKGSKFTVTLNLKLADEPIKFTPIKELQGARVLVVDDDINTCRNVCKMLRDIKMRPDWTCSGKEAIIRTQDANELKDEYKAFIIDYQMPDMNGIETIRRIRKVMSDEIPIIVLTAYDWGDFEKEAREAGVTAFVSKPLFMSELRSALTVPVSENKVPKINKKQYNYNNRHVLLVEDNELNREIASALLKEMGLIVDSVFDGDLAVNKINKEPADKYDVILMDIQMPRMDGYTATREIRTLPNNRKANIPIVAMTANAFEEDRKKSLEVGMNGHIVKPISVEEIAKVLDEIFAEKK